MKERPILFSGAMVRAIIAGRKTQTRRVVTGKVALEWLAPGMFTPEYVASPENHLCPFGARGDRLWVREAWATTQDYDHVPLKDGGFYDADPIWFRAQEGDDRPGRGRWRPSIFMPRWASRLALEVVAVRVERLQEISEADAIKEGCEPRGWADGVEPPAALDVFEALWDAINSKRAPWASNPWAWVVEFKVAA